MRIATIRSAATGLALSGLAMWPPIGAAQAAQPTYAEAQAQALDLAKKGHRAEIGGRTRRAPIANLRPAITYYVSLISALSD